MLTRALPALILTFTMFSSLAASAQDAYVIRIAGDWSTVDEDALVNQLVDDGILTRPMAQNFVTRLKQYNAQSQHDAMAFQQCNSESPKPSWNECYNRIYDIHPANPSQYYYPGAVSKYALDNLWFLKPGDLQKFHDLGTASAKKLQ